MLTKKHIYFILIALCFLIYANSLNNAFVSDDIPAILKNPAIAHPLHFWLDPASLLNSFNYLIAGSNPFLYHFTNVILHSLNTILVFFFLRLFFKTEASFLGACLFAVHPIHSEAVTWVSGKPYIITSLFILSAYLLYHHSTAVNSAPLAQRVSDNRHCEPQRGEAIPFLRLLRSCFGFASQSLAMTIVGQPPQGGVNNGRRMKFISYLFCLFLFSYYIIANVYFYFIFPFFLILTDITFGRWRKTWKLWLPFLVIVILRLLLARSVILQRISFVAQEVGMEVTRTNPIFNFVYSFFAHLGLLLWPAKLTLYHEPAVISSLHLAAGLFFLSLLLISLPVIFKKAKELFFGIGIFVLFLAPTYSPVMVSWLVAERYLYFPSITLSIFLAFFYERIMAGAKRLDPSLKRVSDNRHCEPQRGEAIPFLRLLRSCFGFASQSLAMTIVGEPLKDRKVYPLGLARPILAVVIFIIATYALRTVARNEDWKTPERFWRQTALVSYNSPRAHNNMGDVYSQEGNTEGAIREFKKAIELKADYADAYHNLANTYHRKGDLKEAVRLYQQAVSFNPRLFESHYNLGIIYLNAGELDLARGQMKKALELRPDDTNARAALDLAMEKQTVE